MKKTFEHIFSTFAIALLAVNTTGCNSNSSKTTEKIPPLRVESAIAKSVEMRDKINFTTSATAQRSVTIEPRVSGWLGKIHFSGGDKVSKGERLFTIDPEEINTSIYSAEAELKSAEARLVEANNNYERAIPLSQMGAISQSSFDSYTASYTAAKSAVRSAQEELRRAQLNLSYTYIDAPIAGVVAESPAALGDYVGVGTEFETLTTLSDTDTMEVDLAIPLSRYLKYAPQGRQTNDKNLLSAITLILPDSSTYNTLGRYAYTKRDASSGSSMVVIVGKFANPNGTIRPNMFARVSAEIGEPTQRIMIPQSAVSQLQGTNLVWVIMPDSTASLRRVTLGSKSGEEWQVTSGIEVGERVATSGQLKLHEGAKVKF